MTAVGLVLALMVVVTTNVHRPLKDSLWTLFETEKKMAEPCEQLTDEEVFAETGRSFGKKANYSKPLMFRCREPLYDYADRDSFYDFVVDHMGQELTPIVRKAIEIAQTRGRQAYPWRVRVLAQDPSIKNAVYPFLLTELKRFGQKVHRRKDSLNGHNTLVIDVQNTNTPTELFRLSFYQDPIVTKHRRWRLL